MGKRMTATYDLRRARIIRGVWWSIFAWLLLAEAVASMLQLPVAAMSLTSYVLTYFVPMFLAAGGAFWLAARVHGVERRFWALLGVAVSAIIVPEVWWVWYGQMVDFRGPQVPNWFEIGHLIGVVIFCVLVVSMTEFGSAPLVTRFRVYIDVWGAMIIAYGAIYWWWTLPLFEPIPMGGWRVAAIAAVYPVAGGVMLVTTLLIIFGWKAYRWRTWERLASLSFALYGVGLMSFPVSYADWISAPVQVGVDAYTIALGCGFYLLFMAIVYRATAPAQAVRAEPWPVPEIHPSWLPMLYPSILALALLALGAGALAVANVPGGVVMAVMAVQMATALILRSWLSSVELAHHRARSITDPVTGAYNQRHLYARLPKQLAEAGLAGRSVVAVAFDVVDFRSLVRMSGAELADALLIALATSVRAEAPESSELYRIGRDEFLVIVDGISADESVALARRVNARMTNDMLIEGAPIALSVGVAVYPQHASDTAGLVSKAMASQQLARSAERTDVVVYDPDVVDAADPLARLDRARKHSHRAQLRALAAAVDARDADTRVHSEVLGEIVGAFALILDLPHEQALTLETAALVHDIGKIRIPDEVLLKTGGLTPEDRELINSHPEFGEQILGPADMPEVLPVVRHHHERWDGTGYPDGLIGMEIPFEARVLSICDAFEAMTSARRYRPALPTAAALAELERCAGTQFDPQLAEAFGRMVVALHGSALSAHIAATRKAPDGETF
jgi:diguanylate cyclase (GGDEF)-like protein